MTDTDTPSPIAAKALQRLHKLAEGNGIAPGAIRLFSAEEKNYDIAGTMSLAPLFETQSVRHPGGASRRSRKVVGSAAELKMELDSLRKTFETRPNWISEAIAQLKDQPAGGWGLDDVRVSLPSHSTVLAGSETCPSCQGQKALTCTQCNGAGAITCPQCQGSRQEFCPVCLGSGANPSQPGQPCINCNGLRYSPCRYCRGNGQLPCPTCHGNRAMVCTTCKGAGLFTEEVEVACGARTHFSINGQGLPSGLRRGLDRLGIENMVKGHAHIEIVEPPPDEEEAAIVQPEIDGAQRKEKPPKPEIHYIAHLPYADLRMDFAGKKVIVGVFGLKQVMLDVPPFLDTALEPAREKLKTAGNDAAAFDELLKLRVMHDAMRLHITRQANVNALRKIYPLGLSPAVATEILRNMRLALNRMTLRLRTIAAILCGLLGSGVFAGSFMTPLHARITQGMKPVLALGIDAALLGAVLAGSWFMLSFAARFKLQKRFPEIKIPVTQKTGKTGWTMLAALVAAFAAALFLAEPKPDWVQLIHFK